MFNVLICCVNYNSYESLRMYLDSLRESLEVVKDMDVNIEVRVADNSSTKIDFEYYDSRQMKVSLVPLNNLGYFNGAFAVLNLIKDKSDYNYVIVSNVDITVDKLFFEQLMSYKPSDKTFWITPFVEDRRYASNIAVEQMYRPSKRKVRIRKFIYNHPLLYTLINIFHGKRIRKRQPDNSLCKEMEIYSGTGCIFIFTPYFFRAFPEIHYPGFLYGEEVYISECIIKIGGKNMYVPGIKCYNAGAVSTGKLIRKEKCKYQYQMTKYTFDNFYD